MLHGIAITSPQRLEQLKDVPTTAELGMPEVSYSMWHGLYVAKGTPKETVDTLNAALRAALAEPELLEKLKQLGTLPFPASELTPEAHARLFAADLPRVATLIESSGIKASEAKQDSGSRHDRACPGHPRLPCLWPKTWMPGTRPGLTESRRKSLNSGTAVRTGCQDEGMHS